MSKIVELKPKEKSLVNGGQNYLVDGGKNYQIWHKNDGPCANNEDCYNIATKNVKHASIIRMATWMYESAEIGVIILTPMVFGFISGYRNWIHNCAEYSSDWKQD